MKNFSYKNNCKRCDNFRRKLGSDAWSCAEGIIPTNYKNTLESDISNPEDCFCKEEEGESEEVPPP